MATYQRNSEKYRRQLRGFIAVWIGVTILIGVATFVGIYVGTSHLDTADASNREVRNTVLQNPVPAGNDTASESVVINSDNTANEAVENAESATGANVAEIVQTEDPNPPAPAAPTEEIPNAPAQQDVTPAPTIPAKQNLNFDLGIHVMQNFNNDPGVTAGYMDAAANQLNLNWIKVQVRWEFVEPQPGVYDWAALGYDVFFEEASKKNLKVLTSVVTAPQWAREAGTTEDTNGPPVDNQQFANFIGNMISRYPGQIHAIEVWNEMNLAREWTSSRGLNAADYVSMVTVVSNTVRFIDPNIIIISGALSPTGVNDGVIAIDDFGYTDQMIAAGLLNVVDCFGAHSNGPNIGPNVPFDQVPNDPTAVFRGPFENPHHSWSFYSTMTTYANKIRAAGSNVRLCVTEFGWAVAEDFDPAQRPVEHFEFAEDNTLEEQRTYILEAITLMQEWDFVWLAFIWNLNFGPEMGWDLNRPDNHNMLYSLVRPNYTPAPVWPYIAEMNFRGRPAQ